MKSEDYAIVCWCKDPLLRETDIPERSAVNILRSAGGASRSFTSLSSLRIEFW